MVEKWVGTAYICYGSTYCDHMVVKVGVKEVAKDTYQIDVIHREFEIWIDKLRLII